MPILKGPEGIVETCRQAGRDACVNDHAFGDHVVESQSPQPAEIRRPTEVLGQNRGIQPDFSGMIRQRVHAAPEVNDFSLLDPPRQLEADRLSSVGKYLHQECQIKAGKPTHHGGQVDLFHTR